jgi:cilia- and flagella-associated protein 44
LADKFFDCIRYAQDGNGGIWECDISPENVPAAPKQLFKCHAGPIVSVQSSPTSKHVATLGKDGRIFVYNFDEQKLLFDHQFVAEGRDMIWVPISVGF